MSQFEPGFGSDDTMQVAIADPRTSDVYEVLDELSEIVEHARAVPMSEKCVISRNDALDLLDAIRGRLPRAVQEAEELLADRVGVVEDGYREAERLVAEAQGQARAIIEQARAQAEQIVAEAHAHHVHLLNEHTITQAAQAEAETLRSQAWAESDVIRAQANADVSQMRAEVDDYIEAKFSAFEATLDKTLNAVQTARSRMAERFGAPSRSV